MKYYIIAGEASGDLHASNLMKQLKLKDKDADFRFWGGDLMSAQGGTLVKHYKDLAFMGFLEVVLNLRTILNNISFCKKDIKEYKPDAVILVDYPGFNLRLTPYIKSLGIKVYYYISPQVWAWDTKRVHTIKKYVDKMFAILPFEKDFYAKYDFDADFVGHPLLDAMSDLQLDDKQLFIKENNLNEKSIIALLPGSRKQEVKKMLPLMLSMRDDFPEFQFIVGGAPSLSEDFYREISQTDFKILFGKTYDLLINSHAALVTSGTATLEAALLNIPEVVCYKGNSVSYAITKMLVKNIKYISLPNLIMDKKVVTELIQNDFNYENLKRELSSIIEGSRRNEILDDYGKINDKLGGGASEKTAQLIVEDLMQ